MQAYRDDPREAKADDFPAQGNAEDQARFLLNYAVQAPSSHNTQPWQFRVKDGVVEVLADRGRALPVVDPQNRELTISCGAAIGNLEVAARRFGLRAEVAPSLDPQDDLVASLSLSTGSKPTEGEMALSEAIARRRTDRKAFEVESLPAELLVDCAAVASACGVEASHAEDGATKAVVADLVAEGGRAQLADPRFRRELASWIRSTSLGSRDGISAASFGMPDVLASVMRMLVRTFDVGGRIAAADKSKIETDSPALLVLASASDDKAAWTNTGRALARVLLLLTSRGFSASYFNQPIEVETLRPRLKAAFGLSGAPQLLLRVGRPNSQPTYSVRRSVQDVVLA